MRFNFEGGELSKGEAPAGAGLGGALILAVVWLAAGVWMWFLWR